MRTLTSSSSNTGETMRRLALLTVPTVALLLALTGCTPPGTLEPQTSPSEAATASPEPSVGDEVTPDPTAPPIPSWSKENRPYKMLDNTYVLVSPREPLPENVRSDIEKRLANIEPVLSDSDPARVEATWDAFARFAQQLTEETGRAVIVFTNTAVPASGLPRWVHFGGTARENIPSYLDVPGDGVTFEQYENRVFERSNRDFFDVFYR